MTIVPIITLSITLANAIEFQKILLQF